MSKGEIEEGGEGRKRERKEKKEKKRKKRKEKKKKEKKKKKKRKEKKKTHPDVDAAVLSQALVVKPVDLRDLTRLVIATDQRDPIGVPYLEREEEEEGLDRVEAAVDKVAHEEVVGLGALACWEREGGGRVCVCVCGGGALVR